MSKARARRIRALQRELEKRSEIGNAEEKRLIKAKLKAAQTGGHGWREAAA